MNNIIYKWLLNNNNSNNNETESILELLVILSINGILVDYNSLMNYCNSNGSNKDNESSSPNSGGLNYNQFQILNNNIQSTLIPLFQCNVNDKNTSTTTTVNYNYIKNKFDCLIAIISDNNIRNLNKQQQNQQQPLKKKIVKDCIGSNNHGGDIDFVFFKAWRNIVIKNEILFHARLYNIHSNKKFKIGPDKLERYKYKSYINNLELVESCEAEEFQRIYDVLELPLDLQHFSFTFLSGDIFKFSCLQNLQSLNSISLMGRFNQSLDGGWLSGLNIKSLEFGSKFQQTIKVGHLPQSLTSLILNKSYKGVIEYGSIPKSVKTLYYLYDSSSKSLKTIPKSTTNLVFDEKFNEIIKLGDIPWNVTSLEFGKSFNNEIKVNSLPKSIRTIKFGNNYDQEIIENTLPPNLTSLVFGSSYSKELISPSPIPLSITSIEFNCDYSVTITEGTFSNHTNLKSLKFNENISEISANSLPNSLTHLGIIQYENDITELKELQQVLPSSLKSFCCVSNSNISVGDIPEQLESIEIYKLYDENNNIEIGSFSSNLKSLSFPSQLHSLELTTEGLLPPSLESLYINCNNIDVINQFDSNYFHNKIKLLNNNINNI